MPFQNFEELVNMASRDPKQTNNLVRRAQTSGKPVVSSNNTGYGDKNKARQAALRRSMGKNMLTPQDETVTKRKELRY